MLRTHIPIEGQLFLHPTDKRVLKVRSRASQDYNLLGGIKTILVQVFDKRAQAAEGHKGEVHLQYEFPFLFKY